MRLIDSINSSAELKKLEADELKIVAEEIRKEIIDVVSKNGGHLASNLGVVELTLALCKVFNPPNDKIIWDVGHQCYAYKIINGRRDFFSTLRTKNGISGFPNPDESPCDPFIAGHAGTALSLALGFSASRKIKKEKFDIVPVIGDGVTSCGMVFEALNNASSCADDLTIILNDNKMSISKSVGALADSLSSSVRLNIGFITIRSFLRTVVRNIPWIGKTMLHWAEKLEDRLTYFFCPGAFFESIGFSYLGPFDGHDIPLLISVLEKAKKIEGNKIIHIITKKGKGYSYAEKNPERFHGTGPFSVLSGKSVNSPSPVPSYTKYFGELLIELASEDERIVAITAAMKEGTGLKNFAEKFPNRFFDVGIAEEHAVTFSAAMAKQGLRPIVAIYSTFLQRAFDQIIHDVAIQKLPVIFCIDRAGITGEDGVTHQGGFDLSYLRMIPNLVILAPADELELKVMLKEALSYDGPVAVRYPKRNCVGLPESSLPFFKIGQSDIVCDGKDIVIFSVGSMVFPSMLAIKNLSTNGISAMLINVRTVKPLDEEIILQAGKKFKHVVTIEENVISGGFGSSVAELFSKNNISTDLNIIGLPDEFIEHAHQEELLEKYGLNANGIFKQVLEIVKR